MLKLNSSKNFKLQTFVAEVFPKYSPKEVIGVTKAVRSYVESKDTRLTKKALEKLNWIMRKKSDGDKCGEDDEKTKKVGVKRSGKKNEDAVVSKEEKNTEKKEKAKVEKKEKSGKSKKEIVKKGEKREKKESKKKGKASVEKSVERKKEIVKKEEKSGKSKKEIVKKGEKKEKNESKKKEKASAEKSDEKKKEIEKKEEKKEKKGCEKIEKVPIGFVDDGLAGVWEDDKDEGKPLRMQVTTKCGKSKNPECYQQKKKREIPASYFVGADEYPTEDDVDSDVEEVVKVVRPLKKPQSPENDEKKLVTHDVETNIRMPEMPKQAHSYSPLLGHPEIVKNCDIPRYELMLMTSLGRTTLKFTEEHTIGRFATDLKTFALSSLKYVENSPLDIQLNSKKKCAIAMMSPASVILHLNTLSMRLFSLQSEMEPQSTDCSVGIQKMFETFNIYRKQWMYSWSDEKEKLWGDMIGSNELVDKYVGNTEMYNVFLYIANSL